MTNRKPSRALGLFFLMLLLPFLGVAAIPVILDTDIGDDIDDTWALALALRCPELDVKLVVTDYGKPDYRARLIARLLEVAKRTDIPVGLGIEAGKDQPPRQGKWVDEYSLSRYPGKVERDGVQAMIDLIMNSPQRVTVIAIGPTPTLAEALRREPRIAEKSRFVGMHGSVRVGYGGAAHPDAEWNVRADVPSAQKVFTSSWDMTITPLDTCGLVQLKGPKYARVYESKDTLNQAIIENYRIWEDFQNKGGDKKSNVAVQSSTLYDCVAVYLAIEDKLCQMERVRLKVDDQGFTREDAHGKLINTALKWKDLDGFEDWLVGRLVGKAQSTREAKPK